MTSWRVPLTKYPGMNRFVLDWLSGDERFLKRSTFGVRRQSRRFEGGSIAAALRKQNGEAIDRWQSGETLTIIAGQQVGFAGGPLYTLAKIASLIRLKRDLEKQGIPVTPFFWMATEDHDFDEVATVKIQQQELVRIRAVRPPGPRRVVGPQPIPEELIEQFLALVGIPRPSWLRQGITFGDSFAELVASVFGSEVILVDSLLPELRRAGAPLFEQIHARHDDIQHALAQRAEELERAGYKEQVVPRDGDRYTLLFHLDEHGNRQPATGNWQPETTSTSALTRPLLQDFVFAPDIFIGGPAEVAYYAQINPLHEMLDVPMPRVALRGHVLVAPKRVTRAFERYGIDPCDVFTSADALLAEQEPEGVNRIRILAEEGRRELMQRIEKIGEIALPADHSLAGSIQRSIGHLEWHFNKLAERAIKGLVRKDRERYAAVRELVATLYPDRQVQDRVANWFAFWCVHGQGVIDRVVAEVEPDSTSFKIVEI